MALNYTKTETRTVATGGLTIVETKTTPYLSGVAQSTEVACFVELPKTKFNSIQLARNALASLLAGLDELLP